MAITLINLGHYGRFGNSLFQYCYAKKAAKNLGVALHIPKDWIGNQIFESTDECPKIDGGPSSHNWDIKNIKDGDTISGLWGRPDQQIYSIVEAREFLKIRSEVLAASCSPSYPYVAIHYRYGDYAVGGLPIVPLSNSCELYRKISNGLPLHIISEEYPNINCNLPAPFLQDFLNLCNANILIRGNSSFSYWAGVLNRNNVWAPVMSKGPDYMTFVQSNTEAINPDLGNYQV